MQKIKDDFAKFCKYAKAVVNKYMFFYRKENQLKVIDWRLAAFHPKTCFIGL
jgi:hypothetical protein